MPKISEAKLAQKIKVIFLLIIGINIFATITLTAGYLTNHLENKVEIAKAGTLGLNPQALQKKMNQLLSKKEDILKKALPDLIAIYINTFFTIFLYFWAKKTLIPALSTASILQLFNLPWLEINDYSAFLNEMTMYHFFLMITFISLLIQALKVRKKHRL